MNTSLPLLALAIFQLLPLSVFASVASQTKDTRPNVIFILCDDLGYGDLAVNGHPYVKSPNIDRLATEGLTIQNAYMSAAWCAPSRYALMSGRYPAHYFQKTLTMDAEATNLYRILKNVGFTTAHFGKWHMSGKGPDAPTAADYGVDEDFIHNGKDEGWTKEEREQPHWRENTTQRYIDLAINFIERQKATESPFYLNLWVYPTHSYIDPRADMLEPYRDLQVDIQDFENPLMRDFLTLISTQGDLQAAMRAYCSDVTELDNQIGRLLQALQDLGIDEDTMIVFSSDNGPPPLGGVHNRDQLTKRIKERPTLLNCVGSSGPFRDRKISLND
ncbi:MAG: sulfatase-like hydrolase/transferase, partial [Lentimonas sp.]